MKKLLSSHVLEALCDLHRDHGAHITTSIVTTVDVYVSMGEITVWKNDVEIWNESLKTFDGESVESVLALVNGDVSE